MGSSWIIKPKFLSKRLVAYSDNIVCGSTYSIFVSFFERDNKYKIIGSEQIICMGGYENSDLVKILLYTLTKKDLYKSITSIEILSFWAKLT